MSRLILFVFSSTLLFIGCAGTTTPLETPNPARAPVAPTRIVVTLPTATQTNGTFAPTAPLPTLTRESSETVMPDPTLVKLIADARADLIQRLDSLNVASDSITVKSAEEVEWSDASLGCPQPGMMYAQVITPGYRIILEANGKEYDYHASSTQVELCEE